MEGSEKLRMGNNARLTSLGARVHLFVQPTYRDRFIAMFRDTLGCNVAERDFGLPLPVLFVGFEDGSAFSVEFSDNAPDEYAGEVMSDKHAFRGAWIEFRALDVPALQKKLRDAGIREFQHAGSPHAYFSAPGGQVFRLLDVAYKGP